MVGPSKRQKQWFSRHVLPSINGYTRMPSRLTDKQQHLDYNKRKTSWQTVDYFIDLVSRGTEEELSEYVFDTSTFVRDRKQTSFVVMDQAALWLKLRGEERVVACGEEMEYTTALGQFEKKWRQADIKSKSQVARSSLSSHSSTRPCDKRWQPSTRLQGTSTG